MRWTGRPNSPTSVPRPPERARGPPARQRTGLRRQEHSTHRQPGSSVSPSSTASSYVRSATGSSPPGSVHAARRGGYRLGRAARSVYRGTDIESARNRNDHLQELLALPGVQGERSTTRRHRRRQAERGRGDQRLLPGHPQRCELDGQSDSVGPNGATTANYDYDDLYICDGTTVPGEPVNDFLGDVRVDTLYPNGNGNSSQWVGQDANSTDNYLNVDDTLLPTTTRPTTSRTRSATRTPTPTRISSRRRAPCTASRSTQYAKRQMPARARSAR